MTDDAAAPRTEGLKRGYRVQYFGRRWNAHMFDDAIKVEVPLGAVCLFCDELVDEHDSGIIQPALLTTGPTTAAVHLECHLRSLLGSVSHLARRCSCYGGTEHEGHTRADARAVLEWVIAEQTARGLPNPGFVD